MMLEVIGLNSSALCLGSTAYIPLVEHPAPLQILPLWRSKSPIMRCF